jgi:hypothetical protein
MCAAQICSEAALSDEEPQQKQAQQQNIYSSSCYRCSVYVGEKTMLFLCVDG